MFSKEKRLLKKLATADASIKKSIAQDPSTPPKVLEALTHEHNVAIRWEVAWNSSTSGHTLYALCRDEAKAVRQVALPRLIKLAGYRSAAVAIRDPAAPAYLVGAIAEDISREDLCNILGNGPYPDRKFPKPRIEVLTALFWAKNPSVRAEVARCRLATEAMRTHLATDPEESVRIAVASDAANLPQIAIDALANDTSPKVRLEIAKGTTRPEALSKLVTDSSPKVRQAVACNPNTPDQSLIILASDPDVQVRNLVANGMQHLPPFGFRREYERATPEEALLVLARDSLEQVRIAVARHPGLPLEAFRILTNDHDDAVRRTAAEVIRCGYGLPSDSISCSPQEEDEYEKQFPVEPLSVLSKSPHREIRQAVAQHPKIPAQLLATLLDDPQVFQQREGNAQGLWPNLTLPPFSVLERRTGDDEEAWASLAAVSNPLAREVLAWQEETPDHLLRQYANDERESVREALLENPNLPASILNKLVDDPSPSVAEKAMSLLERAYRGYGHQIGLFKQAKNDRARAVVARSDRASASTLQELALDPAAIVRAAVAENPNTPGAALSSLATDSDPDVIASVAKAIPRVTEVEVLQDFALSPSDDVRAAVAFNPRLSDATLRLLIHDPQESVRLAAANNGYTFGAHLVATFSSNQLNQKHGIGQKRVPALVALAADQTLSCEAIHALAQSVFETVRQSAAKNPRASRATLANLVRDVSPLVRESVAGHANASEEFLITLASDRNVEVRRAVAANTQSTTQVLASLSQDRDDIVAVAVAAHPNTSPSMLLELLNAHDEPRVSEVNLQLISMLESGSGLAIRLLPFSQLLRRQLIRSDMMWFQGVRQAVASNPLLPPEALERLAHQPDTAAFVAANPSTPDAVLVQLLRHDDELVRETLAANHTLSETSLATLAFDRSEKVRASVASNPGTGTHTLEVLEQDFSKLVRTAALAATTNRKAPGSSEYSEP